MFVKAIEEMIAVTHGNKNNEYWAKVFRARGQLAPKNVLVVQLRRLIWMKRARVASRRAKRWLLRSGSHEPLLPANSNLERSDVQRVEAEVSSDKRWPMRLLGGWGPPPAEPVLEQ